MNNSSISLSIRTDETEESNEQANATTTATASNLPTRPPHRVPLSEALTGRAANAHSSMGENYMSGLIKSAQRNNSATEQVNSSSALAPMPMPMLMPMDSSVSPSTYLSHPFPSPPLDWTLHRRVRFTSGIPFNWIAFAASADEAGGLSDFLANKVESDESHSSASFYRKFHSACAFCSYPSSSSLYSRAANSLHLSDSTLTHRWNEWEIAFRSIYFKFRNGETQYFYLDSPTLTVLFVSERANSSAAHSTATSPLGHAILSKSSRALRGILSDRGISFSKPNSRLSMSAQVFDGPAASDFQRLERLKPGSTRVSSDPEKDEDFTIASVLLISGRSSVHQLFDYLLNEFSRSSDGVRRDEVPRLLSPIPFLHAAIEKLDIAAVGKQSKPTETNQMQVQYSLELVGPLLPHSNVRLLRLLRDSQKEFSARYWQEEQNSSQKSNETNNVLRNSSSNFNSLSAVNAIKSLHGFPHGFAIPLASVPEVHRNYTSNNSISSRNPLKVAPPVRRIRCEDNYHIQLVN